MQTVVDGPLRRHLERRNGEDGLRLAGRPLPVRARAGAAARRGRRAARPSRLDDQVGEVECSTVNGPLDAAASDSCGRRDARAGPPGSEPAPRSTDLDRYTSEGIFRECSGPFTRSTPRGGRRRSRSFSTDSPTTSQRKPKPCWRCWSSTATRFGRRSPSRSATDSFEARGLTTGVRLFFVFAPGQRIVVLDGYVKKRTSIPARIMARIRRLQEDTETALRNEGGKNRKN